VSFQLSFAATLGLVLFAGPLNDWLDFRLEKHFSEGQAHGLASLISEYLLFTLAAQVTTLPFIAYHFRRISISSLIANPLILPVQPPILVLGGISTIAGMILPSLGKLLALLAWIPMWYTNLVVEWLSKFKSTGISVHPQATVWILAVTAILIMLFWFRDFFKKLFGKWFIWVVFILIVACFAIWSVFAHLPDGKLHLDLVRVGETSTFILCDPQGKTIVFDPDSSVNELSAEVSRDLSPWNFSIDEVWITDRASVKNLELLLERIPVGKAFLVPNVYLAGADQRPVQIPSEIEAVKLSPGAQVAYPSGLAVRIAAETSDAAALFIEFGRMRMLIPNGVDYAVIRETNPDLLENLTFLVLSEEDISYIPPRVWQALNAEVTLWNSPALSPIPQWLGIDARQRISISSDGTDFSIEKD
jgi:competence protein ComEC